jgi:hypothetical protein
LRRATGAGEKIVLEGAGCRFLIGGAVKMQTVQRGGQWEIETAGEQTAFVAVLPVKIMDQAVGEKQAEKKPVKVVEIDLDLDNEEEQMGKRNPRGNTAGAAAGKRERRQWREANGQTDLGS